MKTMSVEYVDGQTPAWISSYYVCAGNFMTIFMILRLDSGSRIIFFFPIRSGPRTPDILLSRQVFNPLTYLEPYLKIKRFSIFYSIHSFSHISKIFFLYRSMKKQTRLKESNTVN